MERRSLAGSAFLTKRKESRLNRRGSTTEESTSGSETLKKGNRVVLSRKLSALRQKLGHKAKLEPGYRFYTLYDRIYRSDVLATAYRLVRVNWGGPGVDGISFELIESEPGGPARLTQQLQEELRSGRYRPQAVKRVYILKANGKQRPLGIPTIRDRVAQMAALLILEPIFEADFMDCSYGFRPGRCTAHAIAAIAANLKDGLTAVYDADLQGYFDSIPHDKLMKCLRQRISDGSLLRLIEAWLTAPVVEATQARPGVKGGGGGNGRPSRNRRGTPQGGVISPLLANIYLHWFDRPFYGRDGPARWAGARIVRYADDFVVQARYLSPKLVGWMENQLEGRMGLTVNRDKTRQMRINAAGGSLDFLGYTMRYDASLRGGASRYLNIVPSKPAVAREREALRSMTNASQCWVPVPLLIDRINQQLRGWSNAFSYGYPRQARRHLNHFVRDRLTWQLQRRSQRGYKVPAGQTMYRHLAQLGLVYL